MAAMLAAASIWAIDALFGLVARNDAEWHRRELLGRTWRRDWRMRDFAPKMRFSKKIENRARLNLDAKSVPEALVDTALHHFARLSRIKHRWPKC